MLKFFKKNSYEISRFLVMQVGITIFAFVLTMAMSTIKRSAVLWVSIFSVCFYLFLVYSVAWEIGGKDKIRIDAGRQAKTPLRGLFAMLYAQIPNLVLATLMTVGGLIFLLSASPVGARIYGIGYFIVVLFDAMYVGIVDAVVVGGFGKEAYFAMGIAYLLSTLPALLTAWIGYYLGSIGRGIARPNSPTKK